MKKVIFVIAAMMLFFNAQSQESGSFKSKNGKEVLPQPGNWGFGVDGIQFLNYAGNMFSQGGSNSFSLNLPNNSQTFLVKYVKDANTFYRIKARIGYVASKDIEYITEQKDEIDVEDNVEDIYKNKETNVELSFGIEKRRGENRLQGYYGGEFGLYYQSEKDVYEYGNSLSDGSTTGAFTTNFGGNKELSSNGIDLMRTTEKKYGSTLGVGVGLFFGAEYFFAPKMSLGGEFGWNIAFMKSGENTTNYEYWDSFNAREEEFEGKGAGGSVLSIDNTPVGLLTVNLYF